MKLKPTSILLALVTWTLAHSVHLQAAEYVDGPNNRTIRDGMHSCRVGYYAVGIHYTDKKLLCSNEIGSGYSADDERISFDNLVNYTFVPVFDSQGKYTGSSPVAMRVCPRGFAATGIHVDKGLIKCAPAAINYTYFDFNSRRYGMAACPDGYLATGFHVKNAHTQCGN